MNEKRILETADNFVILENAHTMLWGLYDTYFGWDFEKEKVRAQALQKIDCDLDFIAAVLNAADSLVFEHIRDMHAAMGNRTGPVNAFIHNTQRIYGDFLTEAGGGGQDE